MASFQASQERCDLPISVKLLSCCVLLEPGIHGCTDDSAVEGGSNGRPQVLDLLEK